MTRSGELARVLRYHEMTKHHPGRFARSLGYLDWATQPDPFRRYAGARIRRLDCIEPTAVPSFDELYQPGQRSPRPFDRASISQLFYDSLALSAWKSFGGERWSLRCNPSSGNLHPTEAYLLAGPIPGLTERGGLYHYSAFEHGLECRVELSSELWRALRGELPAESLIVGLTSIHWRESWKYGERAYRYCQHDVGHAIAALSFAAAASGWHVRLLDGPSDEQCAALLGIDAQRGPEAEHPDALLLVAPGGDAPEAAGLTLRERASSWRPGAEALARLRDARWAGSENRLSPDHQSWPIIDEVAQAAAYPGSAPTTSVHATAEADMATPGAADAHRAAVELHAATTSGRQILRQRRSAVAMDGATSIDRAVFYRILCRALSAPGTPPFEAFSWPPAVHLVVFVHRVTGLDPGVYVLSRNPAATARLQEALAEELAWERAPGCPAALLLYRIDSGDVRLAARRLSCDQAIAADGAFAVAMLAEFEPRLQARGPWFYRRLFWEAGAIGQLLYLEAEAAGVRGTGIGCFFDEPVHGVLGLSNRAVQSLYHFTVGGPVADPRLRTLPGYAHRSEQLDSDNVGEATGPG